MFLPDVPPWFESWSSLRAVVCVLFAITVAVVAAALTAETMVWLV